MFSTGRVARSVRNAGTATRRRFAETERTDSDDRDVADPENA